MTSLKSCVAWLAATLAAATGGLSAFQVHTRGDPSAPAALLIAGQYELAEARARNAVEELRAVHRDGTLDFAIASDLLLRALVLNGRSADEDMLALARRTLDVKESHLGIDHPDLVPSLTNLADVLVDLLRVDEGVAVMELALRIVERRGARDSLTLAEVLDHLGRAIGAAGRYDQALAVLERSIRIKESALGGNDASLARTLEDMAAILQRKGEYAKSGGIIRRAANLQETANSHHPDFIRTLNLEAQQFWFEGLLVESKRASEQAVTLAERSLRPDHPVLAVSLRYLAGTLADLGELNGSMALRHRALAIAERGFGPQHHVTGVYLHTLGYAEFRLGAYTTARSHLQRALTIFEARYGNWHEYVATTLSVLALTDAKLGDYDKARREQSRAVAIHSKRGGPNHPLVALALTELATVYREEGLPADALPLLERALLIREKALGSRHRDVARTLADLASVLVLTGRESRALTLAKRARDIWEQLDAPDAPEFATVLALSAQISLRRGDYAAAREQFSRALEIRSRVFGKSHPWYAEAQAGLGLALASVGETSAAVDLAIEAESSGRTHLQLMLRSLPERQALNYASARPNGLSLILSLVESASEATPLALDALIRSRALVLDEVAARHGAKRTQGDDNDAAFAALASAQQRLANLVVRGPEALSSAQYTAVVDSARRESEAAEQALAARNTEFRTALSRAQMGLGDVVGAIPADSALVSFVRYDRILFQADPHHAPSSIGRKRVGPGPVPSYMAFVLRPNERPSAISLGAAAEIDALISEWRQAVANQGGPASALPSSQSSPRISGAALRRVVWDPIAKHVGVSKRVFIVPDGALSLLPFAALPVATRSFLLETGPVLHYLSAERDIVPTRNEPIAERRLLAVGGPAFNSAVGQRGGNAPVARASSKDGASLRRSPLCGNSFRTIQFEPLQGTLHEVKDVSNLWNASAASSGNVDSARVLVGRDANEAEFKHEAQRSSILHLATHGFFLNDTCLPMENSGTRGVGGVALHDATVQNPLRLSGLALAGANRRGSVGLREEDGILTAEEVATLNLASVEWAVLSACDTGLGEIKAGEGVFGLRRAFQVAGARTVIMSLWAVDDQATRLWMHALYEGRLQKHLSTADAMHQASLTILKARRARGQSTNPFYWAGFVAAGDWR